MRSTASVDARGGEIVAQHASRRRDLAAGAGVDQDELFSGIDDQRRERRRQLVGRHEGLRQRVLDLDKGRVADEFVGDRTIPDAVIERGQFVGPDLVTIDAGDLGAGRRRLRRARFGAGRENSGGGRTGKKSAPGQVRQARDLRFPRIVTQTAAEYSRTIKALARPGTAQVGLPDGAAQLPVL